MTTLHGAEKQGFHGTGGHLFKHFGLNPFVIYMNGSQIPFESLSLNIASAKTCTKAYQTLFIDLGIRHENKGIQITPNLLMKGLLMFIYDLTPDGCASHGHTNLPDNGNFRNELKFDKAINVAVTIFLYLEFDVITQIDTLRKVTTDFSDMYTLQIYRSLSNVRIFPGVFPYDLLPIYTLHGTRQIRLHHKHGYSHRDQQSLGRRQSLNEVIKRLLFRLVRTLPARSNYTQFSTKDFHSVGLQHSHPARFHHRRVRTGRMSLRELNGQRTRSSPDCELFGTTVSEWHVEAAFVS